MTPAEYDKVVLKLRDDVDKLRADLDLERRQLRKLYKIVGASP
jgi:hypothetical protein